MKSLMYDRYYFGTYVTNLISSMKSLLIYLRSYMYMYFQVVTRVKIKIEFGNAAC